MATLTKEQIDLKAQLAELAALKAENAALKQAKADAALNRKLTCKVSAKGAVSVYGLGRFPVTLYKEQWNALLKAETVASLVKFLKDNDGALKTKGDD